MSEALDLAQRALRAADGDEALAVAQSERSGMARFAGSEVHQPTLIENEVIEVQVVRDGRLGIATGNRTEDEGLRALAARPARPSWTSRSWMSAFSISVGWCTSEPA